jgi:hypothetical protein
VPDDHSASAPLRSAQPGNLITFGVYPQTAEDADRTPIRWRVLENSGRELFVLSERLLDSRRYHREFVDTTWRDCDLRTWLNGEFYNAAFDAAEQGVIRTTLCTDNGAGSPDTEDRVFLLGVDEVKSVTSAQGDERFEFGRRARGTEFAKIRKADGCKLWVYDKSVSTDYLTENGERHGCSWWWLRTQPKEPSRAAFVGMRGSVRSYGRVNLAGYGVRPALRIGL